MTAKHGEMLNPHSGEMSVTFGKRWQRRGGWVFKPKVRVTTDEPQRAAWPGSAPAGECQSLRFGYRREMLQGPGCSFQHGLSWSGVKAPEVQAAYAHGTPLQRRTPMARALCAPRCLGGVGHARGAGVPQEGTRLRGAR